MSEIEKTSAKRAKGSVKEAIGKLTGDSKVERAGHREKTEAAGAANSATSVKEPRKSAPDKTNREYRS